MLVLTPWNARSVALFSWQLTHVRLATTVWLAVDSDGAVVILKPPVTKFAPWQLWQLSALTAVWPVEDSSGVLVSLKPVPLSVSLTAWQPEQSALLTGM